MRKVGGNGGAEGGERLALARAGGGALVPEYQVDGTRKGELSLEPHTDALGSSSHQMRTPDRSHSERLELLSSARPRGRTSGGFVASVRPYRRCHPRYRLPHDRVCSRVPTRTQTKPAKVSFRPELTDPN